MYLFAQAARASVASTVSELVDILPKLASCRRQESFLQNRVGARDTFDARATRTLRDVSQGSGSEIEKAVDTSNGIEAIAVSSLMKEAREAVIAARGMLF